MVEFYDELAEIALGWLGWDEEKTLKADVNAIQIGYSGKVDMFCTIGYLQRKGQEPTAEAPLAPMTPALFRAMFGR